MVSQQSRAPINGIIYSVMFTRQFDESAVANIVDAILTRRGLAAGPQVYFDALTEVVTSQDLAGLMKSEHPEPQLLAFFEQVRDRLDGARPWPVPPYVKLPLSEWDNEPQQAIARLELTTMQVGDRLRQSFESLPHGDGKLFGLVLRLSSGCSVALLGAGGPGNRVTLLQRGGGDPHAIAAEFRTAAGLADDEVTLLV